eukprot:RCo007152
MNGGRQNTASLRSQTVYLLVAGVRGRDIPFGDPGGREEAGLSPQRSSLVDAARRSPGGGRNIPVPRLLLSGLPLDSAGRNPAFCSGPERMGVARIAVLGPMLEVGRRGGARTMEGGEAVAVVVLREERGVQRWRSPIEREETNGHLCEGTAAAPGTSNPPPSEATRVIARVVGDKGLVGKVGEPGELRGSSSERSSHEIESIGGTPRGEGAARDRVAGDCATLEPCGSEGEQSPRAPCGGEKEGARPAREGGERSVGLGSSRDSSGSKKLDEGALDSLFAVGDMARPSSKTGRVGISTCLKVCAISSRVRGANLNLGCSLSLACRVVSRLCTRAFRIRSCGSCSRSRFAPRRDSRAAFMVRNHWWNLCTKSAR